MASKGRTIGIVVGCLVVAVIATIIGVVAKSFKKLDSHEMGIKYNTFTKELGDEVFSEGLHIGSPSYVFLKFPSVFQSMEYSGERCLDKDGVFVTLSISFQYRARATGLRRILEDFETEERYETVLGHLGRSAILDACSLFNTTQFQAERGSFQEALTRKIIEKFDKLWADVTDLQVRNVQRPSRYEQVIRAKESAREEIEVAHNEGPRRLTEVRTVLREAETEAEIIVTRALSEARISTTRAEARATGILNDYKQEAATYKSVKQSNSLTNEGFLSYMGVRVISDASNAVQVGMKGPAKTSYMP